MTSCFTIRDHRLFSTLIESRVAKALEKHTRAVVVVQSTPKHWLRAFAQQHGYDYLPDTSSTDRSDRITALLGSERRVGVIQLGNKPDYGLLAAMAGTVQAGGLFIIGIAGAEAETGDLSSAPRNSLKRLARLAQLMATEYPEHMLFADYAAEPDITIDDINSGAVSQNISDLRFQLTGFQNPQATAEQDALLKQAYDHIASSSRSCTFISGRRGRGKSTLMARLAVKLSLGGAQITVTAMHESALSTYRRLAGTTGDFLSPESVAKGSVDTLLIDEAASFSIQQLNSYSNICRHLILSTTVEGYEAAGRALAIRIMSTESDNRATMLQLEPLHPWRWSLGDPLEEFIDRILLTRASPSSLNVKNTPPRELVLMARNCKPKQVSQDELLNDELLLASIHTLLLSTHYQTSTKDLEHLLDAPTVQLWIQQIDTSVVGVLLLEYEGVIEYALHEDIIAKRRRLPNQLLPQLLAQMANSKACLTKRYARILRLATTPELRRQGIASRLLDMVIERLSMKTHLEQGRLAEKAVSAIGASFAADNASMKFWQSKGFEEFHRGFKFNPRTGKRSVTVMQCYDPECTAVLEQAVSIQNDNEHSRRLFQQGKAYVVNARKGDYLGENENNNVSFTSDLDLLRRFTAGQRSYHDTFAALHRLASITCLSLDGHAEQGQKHYERSLRKQVGLWLDSLSPHN